MQLFISIFLLNFALNTIGDTYHGIVDSEDYHPNQCNVTRYKFTLIKGLVHGLWPEGCSQCDKCGYPTCCNMTTFGKFDMPSDTSFIDQFWFNGESHHPSQVCGLAVNTLFEHEVLKHGSCMGLFADEYMYIVRKVHNMYYHSLDKLCYSTSSLNQKDVNSLKFSYRTSKSECEINLNADFSLTINI